MGNIEGKVSIPINYLGLLETSWATLQSTVGHSVVRQRDAEGKVEYWSVGSADRELHLKLGWEDQSVGWVQKMTEMWGSAASGN